MSASRDFQHSFAFSCCFLTLYNNNKRNSNNYNNNAHTHPHNILICMPGNFPNNYFATAISQGVWWVAVSHRHPMVVTFAWQCSFTWIISHPRPCHLSHHIALCSLQPKKRKSFGIRFTTTL